MRKVGALWGSLMMNYVGLIPAGIRRQPSSEVVQSRSTELSIFGGGAHTQAGDEPGGDSVFRLGSGGGQKLVEVEIVGVARTGGRTEGRPKGGPATTSPWA